MKLKTANRRRKIQQNKDEFYERWPIGAIYHACSLHPCYITYVDFNSIEGKSVLDGTELHDCSITNCGVYIMSRKEIEQYKDAWTRDGERGLMSVYYGSEQAADEFIKNWR